MKQIKTILFAFGCSFLLSGTKAFAQVERLPDEASYPVLQELAGVETPAVLLSGTWQFRYSPDSKWDKIQVPGEPAMQGYAIEHDKPFTYRKSFTVPADYAGKHTILRFDGVYSYARLFVNDTFVREHHGGFTRWDTYRQNQGRITSYFVDQVVNDVIADLMTQKGYSEDFATQQVYNGGLKIYSTMDPNIQNIMEGIFTNTSNFPYTGKGAQSAMIIIDPYTGKIRGLIGGLGEKTDIRGWNRATQSKRQPGSSIKPLSVYAPAVDMGKITEVDTVTDEEITIGNDKWKPKNSYNDFLGDMTIKEAVARSANIPAVKVLDMVNLTNSFNYLQNKFHITTLEEKDKNYSSLALGGLTQGVTVEEMAGAYCTFVNSGKYIKPYTYTRVLDSTGQVILENTSSTSQAISPAAAYITADLLSGVVNSSVGTGKGAKLDCGISTYGKTGTTDDDCDKWFVGFTPYYVGACWYGFDNPASISAAGVSGNPTVTAWNLVMEKIHESLNPKEITKPSNVVEAQVCEYSGMLATDTCPTTTAYFVEGTQPKAYCDASHASRRNKPTQTPLSTVAPVNTPSVMPTVNPAASETHENQNGNNSNTSSGINSGSSSSTNSGSSSSTNSGTNSGSYDTNSGSSTSSNSGGTDYEQGNTGSSESENTAGGAEEDTSSEE